MSESLTYPGARAQDRDQAHSLFAQTMGYVAATAALFALGAFGLLAGLAPAPVLAACTSMGPQALWQAGGATALFIARLRGGRVRHQARPHAGRPGELLGAAGPDRVRHRADLRQHPRRRATLGHRAQKARPMEYLVTMTTHVPEETPGQTVAGIRAHVAAHSSELAGQGHLLRLWRPPLRPANRARWVVAPPGTWPRRRRS